MFINPFLKPIPEIEKQSEASPYQLEIERLRHIARIEQNGWSLGAGRSRSGWVQVGAERDRCRAEQRAERSREQDQAGAGRGPDRRRRGETKISGEGDARLPWGEWGWLGKRQGIGEVGAVLV